MVRGRKTRPGRKRRRQRGQKGGFIRSAYTNKGLPLLANLYGKLALSMYKKVTKRKGL